MFRLIWLSLRPLYFNTPSFPTVPPPRNPPPPAATPAPPARSARAVQGAEAGTRNLFRRRGRRATQLTAGGAAGITNPVSPVRKSLLGQ